MPYPYSKKLLLWPSYCEKVSVTDQFQIDAGSDENCFAQVIAGRAVVRNNGVDYPVGMDAVIVLGRNFSTTVESVPGHPCQLLFMRLRHSNEYPSVDLNHLCLTMPIVDTFFSFKTRFCLLTDREYIRLTFTAIAYEMSHQNPEREYMLRLMLEEFLVKLARSFHTHEKPTGVQFLTRAREYIRLHFQQQLSVDEIAQHAGISRSYLAQLFATHMGYSTVEYIQAVRCDHAAYLLRTTRFAIVDIALEVGFNSRQHFARTFGAIYGVTPNQYRREHRMNQQQ